MITFTLWCILGGCITFGLFFCLISFIGYYFVHKFSYGICKCSKHMVGKVVIVTGANSGLGYETAARDLAERGARVLLACRSEARGAAARAALRAATGSADLHVRALDLASLASVRAFAAGVLATEPRLDVLVNNAGVFGRGNAATGDGLPLCLQVNYYGPFLLTNLLLPLLKSSSPSRIINVASDIHRLDHLNFAIENLNAPMKDGTISNYKAYGISKLCNVLMTVELAERLKGTGVTSYSLHPGIVATEITRNMGGLVSKFIKCVLGLVSRTAWEGAQTQIYLSVAPERELSELNGCYFSNCHVKRASRAARDKELAAKLWEASEKLVGIK